MIETMIHDFYYEQYILAKIDLCKSKYNYLSRYLAEDDPKLEAIRCEWKDWRKNLDSCRYYFETHS